MGVYHLVPVMCCHRIRIWRLWGLLALLVACALLSAVAGEATVVRIGKRTEIVSAPKYGVDLGVIDQHRTVDCSFSITNNNWRERCVLGATGNCVCLETDVKTGVLRRGEACRVKVVFNPAGMEGPVEKLVTVKMEGKTVEYPVKADVRLRLGLRPTDANFGVIEVGKDAGAPIACRLSGYAAATAKVTLVAPDHPHFDVRLDDGTVTAAFREPPTAPGSYTEIWKLKTSDAEIPEISLPVSARVTGGLSVAPRRLDLPRTGGVCTRQVLIRAAAGSATARAPSPHALTVLGAETKPRKWGDVTILPRPLNGWLIRIANIDPAAVRQFSKKPYLEVKTDFPGMETFSVPLAVEPFDETKGADR